MRGHDFLAQARRQMLAGQLNDNRERLLAAIEGLSPEQMVVPGVCGDWSVRDILGHIAAWDRASTDAYRKMVEGERPPILDLDDAGIDEFNAEHHKESEGLSGEQAINELLAAREEMVTFLRDVDNTQLFAPAPEDEHADLSIAACIEVSASHDEEHAEMIEAWRVEQAG